MLIRVASLCLLAWIAVDAAMSVAGPVAEWAEMSQILRTNGEQRHAT